ncbi:hypothetical protein L6164_007296 [Bauhinia variegata]|uniref:Uncharacterized protein n=1 Tax=Bauhinia variegata TaxID=167791 RepID=A0ACB9PEK0_BAUVA|nr:hypothetical protein L6164_007296 [Bauhinia variegata]
MPLISLVAGCSDYVCKMSNVSFRLPLSVTKVAWASNVSAKKWIINSTVQKEDTITSDGEESISDDDLCMLLKKFPEVLGCNLEKD